MYIYNQMNSLYKLKIIDSIYFIPTIFFAVFIFFYLFVISSKSYYYYNLDYKLKDENLIEMTFLNYLERTQVNGVYIQLFKNLILPNNLKKISSDFIEEVSTKELSNFIKNNKFDKDSIITINNYIDSISTGDSKIDKLILISKTTNIDTVIELFETIIVQTNNFIKEIITDRVAFIINENSEITGILKNLQDDKLRKEVSDLTQIDLNKLSVLPDKFMIIDDEKLDIKISQLENERSLLNIEVIKNMELLLDLNIAVFDKKRLITAKYPANKEAKLVFYVLLFFAINYFIVFAFRYLKNNK